MVAHGFALCAQWSLQGTRSATLPIATRTDLILQNLAPIYEELADAYVYAKDKVVIAKVDADGAGKSLGTKYGIKGFPSASARIEAVRI